MIALQDGFGVLLGGLSPFLQSSWDPRGPRPRSYPNQPDVWGHDMTLGYVGDHTAQLCGDYLKNIKDPILNN